MEKVCQGIEAMNNVEDIMGAIRLANKLTTETVGSAEPYSSRSATTFWWASMTWRGSTGGTDFITLFVRFSLAMCASHQCCVKRRVDLGIADFWHAEHAELLVSLQADRHLTRQSYELDQEFVLGLKQKCSPAKTASFCHKELYGEGSEYWLAISAN